MQLKFLENDIFYGKQTEHVIEKKITYQMRIRSKQIKSPLPQADVTLKLWTKWNPISRKYSLDFYKTKSWAVQHGRKLCLQFSWLFSHLITEQRKSQYQLWNQRLIWNNALFHREMIQMRIECSILTELTQH